MVTAGQLAADNRGYQLIARVDQPEGETIYAAGCRRFTYSDAVRHWSDPDHLSPEDAAILLALVEAHHDPTGA